MEYYWLLFGLFLSNFVTNTQALKFILKNENERFYDSEPSNFSVLLITNGSYVLKVNNKTWLSSSPKVYLRANNADYSTVDRSLNLTGTFANSGYDVLGRWQFIKFNYTLYNDPQTYMECSLYTYDDYNLVRFSQSFPKGAKKTSIPFNYDSVLSTFPSFNVKNYDDLDIGYLSFGGMMAGDMEKTYGKWNSLTTHINDGIAGGPLILFDRDGNTLVISQMSEFMSTSIQHEKYAGGFLNYGIMSGVDDVPENFTAEFLVYYSDKGINKAMQEWGNILLKYHNKNTTLRDNDFMINYLSYWMDNGAYYYWMTEDGKTYQDTILDIVNDFKSNIIPFRSIQYDSWWYGAQKGFRQGCFEWNGNIPSDRFPSSMEYVYKMTQMPITAHNKFWDLKVVYAIDNGGSYNFILDSFTAKSLPDDQKFWDDLFKNATKWGLKTYEQDWLNHQTLDFTPLMTDISLGKRWLKQMGNAALKNNLTLQYCMSLSRHVLQSLEIDAVTQVRVTNDYATNWDYGGQQWRLGVSSIFSAAIGLAPFKDVYWTSSVEPGNPYGPKVVDPYVEINSAVSILTAGPVGPGDKMGQYMNKTLIMRSCNEDGLLLKPSRPITSIDAQMHAAAFGYSYGPNGEVWSTYSNISGLVFGIIFAADIKNTYNLNPKNVGFDVKNVSYYWKDKSPNDVYQFTNYTKINEIILDEKCSILNFCLFHFSPAINIGSNQVVILGEQSKWVPISPQRVINIQSSSNTMSIQLNGAINEKIEFSFYINSNYQKVECNFSSKNKATINVDLSSTIKLSCS